MKKKKKVSANRAYPLLMAAPGLIIYIIVFVIPTFASFYFSMTRWNLRTTEWVGFQNFVTFFSMANTRTAMINTAIYAFSTCAFKVIVALLLAQYLAGQMRSAGYLKTMFFLPTLLGNVAVAIAFSSILDQHGILNQMLARAGIPAIRWITDSKYAMFSCIVIDIWKGIGTALVIYVAGISAISKDYYEAAAIDGATPRQSFFKITCPLMVPSINSVLTLSLIGGLRSYELVFALTGGGPGYSTEVLGSVIYKLFSRGQYGLATAGYVIMFIVVSLIVFPINSFVAKREAEL